MAENKSNIKVLMAKTSLDGHWRGVAMVTTALRDAGMEVIYGGMITPRQIVETAIQEDVDVIGINIGGRYGVVKELMDLLKQKNLDNILVVAGGVIPPSDIPLLKGMGIHEIFPPGSELEKIVRHIKENVPGKKASEVR
ncbi:MAG: cobalamin B12-binding domain-containing protein [Candidatus Tectomicrobia bacterium]|uniref:Cobalamin B12-binding domain-containing protein n=1 Tax=Tectimicrobiota bacterium TaxID=2528274 RepID=A0A933GMK4_UNCTE|nr:cobalamin B12-binding domain-containing protein [Candidatus Tectomicrobia bacterium]